MSHRWFSLSTPPVRRAGALVAAGLATATFLTACGSSSTGNSGSAAPAGTSSTTSTTGSGSGNSADAAGIAKAKADIAKAMQPRTQWPAVQKIAHPVDLHGKKIMLVPVVGTVSVLSGMANTAKNVLTQLGATVTICDGKADPTQVANCLGQAKSQGDFAVGTLFVSYQMAPNAFDALAASGTKIVITGDEPQPGKTYPAGLQFSNSQNNLMNMSRLQAEQALADFGDKANLIVEELTDTGDQIAQGQAVVSELAKLCPDCTSTVMKMTTANADKVASQVSAALVSHPDANVITLPVDTWMPQTLQGVQAAGRAGKVELISTGSDVDGLQRVASGQESADFGSSVVLDGYELVDALERDMAGEKVVPAFMQTRDFVKSNVQGLTLTPAAYNSTEWFGTDGFKKNFMTAWGAS